MFPKTSPIDGNIGRLWAGLLHRVSSTLQERVEVNRIERPLRFPVTTARALPEYALT